MVQSPPKQLRKELEVSVRTIYRDVADLIASGVPIDGEAAVFGLAVAEEWGDEKLAVAAGSLRDDRKFEDLMEQQWFGG